MRGRTVPARGRNLRVLRRVRVPDIPREDGGSAGDRDLPRVRLTPLIGGSVLPTVSGMEAEITERLVPFGEWQTWCRVTGALGSGVPPLVTLHGGPGATHDYLLSIAALSERGRPVVHYDQLGNGRSTHLPQRGPELWTVGLFLRELDNLLDALGIRDGYHLLGQSWGGMLAAEHAVLRPAGLRSLVLADSPASIGLWSSEADRLRAGLPAEVQATLTAHEAAGSTDDPAYLAACEVYYARHVCRVVPYPPEVAASFDAIGADPTVYHTMNGPSELHVVGTLREWTIVDRLGDISVPTLVVTGAYDEATPATVRPLLEGIAGARWEVFEDSSHMPHVEETGRFLDVVGEWLDSCDGTAGAAGTADRHSASVSNSASVSVSSSASLSSSASEGGLIGGR